LGNRHPAGDTYTAYGCSTTFDGDPASDTFPERPRRPASRRPRISNSCIAISVVRRAARTDRMSRVDDCVYVYASLYGLGDARWDTCLDEQRTEKEICVSVLGQQGRNVRWPRAGFFLPQYPRNTHAPRSLLLPH